MNKHTDEELELVDMLIMAKEQVRELETWMAEEKIKAKRPRTIAEQLRQMLDSALAATSRILR